MREGGVLDYGLGSLTILMERVEVLGEAICDGIVEGDFENGIEV
jgi:hypothetical protein